MDSSKRCQKLEDEGLALAILFANNREQQIMCSIPRAGVFPVNWAGALHEESDAACLREVEVGPPTAPIFATGTVSAYGLSTLSIRCSCVFYSSLTAT